MFERMSLYLKRFLIVIGGIFLYYLLIFFAVDTKGVVAEKQELDKYISSGYEVYLDGEPVGTDHIYTLITDYEYTIDNKNNIIYFYSKD